MTQETKYLEKTIELMKRHNFDAEIIEHLNIDGTNSIDAARGLGIPINNVIKCLLLRSKISEIICCILLGNQKLNLKRVKETSGLKKLSFLAPEEIQNRFEFQIGGVPPVALFGEIPIYIDSEVMNQSFLIGSAGTRFHGLKFKPESLSKFATHILKISNN